MTVQTSTAYTNHDGTWVTTNYDLAIHMAYRDAINNNQLFSEIYDKTTNMVVGYVSSDGKEM